MDTKNYLHLLIFCCVIYPTTFARLTTHMTTTAQATTTTAQATTTTAQATTTRLTTLPAWSTVSSTTATTTLRFATFGATSTPGVVVSTTWRTSSTDDTDSDRWLIIGFSVAASIAVIVSLITPAVLCYRRRRSSRQDPRKSRPGTLPPRRRAPLVSSGSLPPSSNTNNSAVQPHAGAVAEARRAGYGKRRTGHRKPRAAPAAKPGGLYRNTPASGPGTTEKTAAVSRMQSASAAARAESTASSDRYEEIGSDTPSQRNTYLEPVTQAARSDGTYEALSSERGAAPSYVRPKRRR